MSVKTNKSKPRLGRGLSSLISVSELPVERDVSGETVAVELRSEVGSSARVDGLAGPAAEAASPAASPGQPPRGSLEIEVESITPNPHQPRRGMNETGIAELAASLKSTGLIQPIVVRKAESGYQLIAGERRLRAAKLAGFVSIPAIVREVDSFTQAQMALVENIQREDLNPIDRAQSYRALVDQLGLTQAELAQRLGEDRSSVANYMRLLELAEPVRELVRESKLSLGHAKILAGVQDILEQQRLANLVVSQDLSVRNLERLVADQPVTAPAPRASSATAHLLDLEKSIARQLGMRVQVRSGRKGKGRLVIHYGSLDQFDELLGRMGVRTDS
jgi:ParB family chromosome partitioning protein